MKKMISIFVSILFALTISGISFAQSETTTTGEAQELSKENQMEKAQKKAHKKAKKTKKREEIQKSQEDGRRPERPGKGTFRTSQQVGQVLPGIGTVRDLSGAARILGAPFVST